MFDPFIKFVEAEIQNDIGEVYIKNPPHNYMSQEVINELLMMHGFLSVAERAQKFKVRGIIISGRGRVFSAGASLDMLGEVKERKAQIDLANRIEEAMALLENSKVPVIAAMNGLCLGAGLELALSCHYRICGKGVYLGFPEINLGLMPGAGGTQKLPRLIGRSKAQYLILSGRFITAEEALQMGIVDMVVPRKDVMSAARKIAQEVCTKHEKATALALKAIGASQNALPDDGRQTERECFWELVNDRLAERGLSSADVGFHFTKEQSNSG